MSQDRLQDAPNVEVVATELRALLFWAGVGVELSIGGQYSTEIEDIIRSYSSHLHLAAPYARFKKKLDSKKESPC